MGSFAVRPVSFGADCRQADADQRAHQQAERERAEAEAVAAEAKHSGSWWRRS